MRPAHLLLLMIPVAALVTTAAALTDVGGADGGQPQAPAFAVGDNLQDWDVHIINSPGYYGLGPYPVKGTYALAGGKLIRIDPATSEVLAILRDQATPLD